MRDADVIIVGAGVAGLACAVTLQQAGKRVLVIDAADAVGGRVRTDICHDFALDRGFQVLLSAYPTCRRLLDMEALHLGHFDPGARIQLEHRSCTVTDPFRNPAGLLPTLLAPVGTLGDKLKIARLRSRLLEMPVEEVWRLPNQSTADFLQDWGFSAEIVARFFQPFLSGIFLEPGLATSARMFAFVYRCFSAGTASLPAGGMCAIPNQLEARLEAEAVLLNTRVQSVARDAVTLATGEVLAAQAVVVATDGDQARQWFPQLPARTWSGGTTYYFDAPEAPLRTEKLLWLNSTGRGRINHVAVPSAVAAGYAPPGRALVCVSCLEPEAVPDAPGPLRDELVRFFGSPAREWRFLRAYPLPRSLPRLHPEDIAALEGVPRTIEGVHLCGDFLAAGSLDGAMASGIAAAEGVLG